MSTAAGVLTGLATSPSVTTGAAETLTVTITGSGTVTGGGISCPGTCSKDYPAGTPVTLTATAAHGFTFAGWHGACTGTGACHVVMSSGQSVGAMFMVTKPPVTCVVPKLKGKSLSKARGLLSKAHCALGKVSKPKVKKGHKQPKLVVGSTTPKAGSKLPSGGKVAVKLVPAPKKKK
jgi:hypothetical protein